MNRLLVFHYHDRAGNAVRMAPSAYYIDADYEKVAVRVYAEGAPIRDATFDIFDDGVSIFNNRTARSYNITTGVDTTAAAVTEAQLPKGVNSDEIAEDFTNTPIEQGSWVYCTLVDGGGGKNFTVQLELRQVSEDDESED